MERWQLIPGFPGYEVSNHGCVKSYKRTKPRILKPFTTKKGYRFVKIVHKDGKLRCRKIGYLVLRAFVGPRPKGKHVAHWDGNSSNDFLKNLRWATAKENIDDKNRHGTMANGQKIWTNKLTEKDVLEIRNRYIRRSKGRNNQSSLADEFGVDITQIGHIVNGQQWKQLLKVKNG